MKTQPARIKQLPRLKRITSSLCKLIKRDKQLKTPIVASEGSLGLIPGAALPEKTLSNLETFIQYSYLSCMIYIVCVERRGREEAETGFGIGGKG